MSGRFDIHLSPPHVGSAERQGLLRAFESNWIAPLGPEVDAFEAEFRDLIGARAALALDSGTAALHLALLVSGVRPGDEVLVSTLTFVASAGPICHIGAHPVFIDSESSTWNLDPALVLDELERLVRRGRPPRAVVAVDLYGHPADLDPIRDACDRAGVKLIEDAAEALGARSHGRPSGMLGHFGVFSFNGNKIITTSAGGMLVSADESAMHHARKLATQAREPAPHYEHRELGFNYRMSNLLAALGRAQVHRLEARVAARRRNFEYYQARLSLLPGLAFMPEASWARHTRWLTTLTIDPEEFGADREAVRLALEEGRIESRPLWKPMHLQPVFAGRRTLGGSVAADLFSRGLCLPSGSSLSEAELDRVCTVIERVHAASPTRFQST